jgi:hypothetical protein
MSVGICSFFGLTPTLNGGEIFPYLIIFIGFENIVVLTKSVVSTPFDLDVRYRIALGLKKESWLITKILTFELIIIFCGILTMVPAIQEFCVFAYVGLLIDFFMQMIFFVTVLSIDIRRMELSDLNRKLHNSNSYHSSEARTVEKKQTNNAKTSSNSSNGVSPSSSNNITYRGSLYDGSKLINERTEQENKQDEAKKDLLKERKYGTYLMNKSVQFFYFWARTRIVQRAVMVLSIVWIVLICYKSMLVVELMRHDVNVRKETVEALLPKGVGLPRLIKDNFQQYLFSTSSPSLVTNKIKSDSFIASNMPPQSSTIDYIKRHFQNILIVASFTKKSDVNQAQISAAKNEIDAAVNSNTNSFRSTSESSSTLLKTKQNFAEQNWQTLNYYHWLSLFANYNVSLYNRYVAILPQIDLFKIVKSDDVLNYRNLNEIKNYNTVIAIDNEHRFNFKTNNLDTTSMNKTSSSDTNENSLVYRSALFELITIVVLGIPTILLVVYLVILFYKCLCSTKYEKWRKYWSTTNIKRQYKMIHSRIKRKSKTSVRNSLSCTCSFMSKSKSEHESDCDFYEAGLNGYQKSNETKKKKMSDEEFSDASSLSDEGLESDDSSCSSRMSRNISKDDLINKIINGQKDDIELKPYKLFNSSHDTDEKFSDLACKWHKKNHNYPIDLIACGNYLCATSDLNNQINIWSLMSANTLMLHPSIRESAQLLSFLNDPNDLIVSIEMNSNTSSANASPVSIWSMCLTSDDNYLLAGQSDGQLAVFDLFSDRACSAARKSCSFSSNTHGITHILQINKTAYSNSPKSLLLKHLDSVEKSSSSFLLQNSTSNSNNTSSASLNGLVNDSSQSSDLVVYLVLCVRLNGHLELVKFNSVGKSANDQISASTFSLVSSIRVDHTPITNLFYAYGGDYLITTSQDCLMKVVKVNKFVDQMPNSGEDLKIILVSNEHGSSMITAMCIDNENTLNAATGSQDGTICLWNLFTGQLKFKLKTNNFDSHKLNKSKHRDTNNKLSPIIKLEIAQSLIVSLNADQHMCIWNTTNGKLVKEFKFFAPISLPNTNSIDSGDINFTTDNCLNSYTSSFFSYIVVGLYHFVKNNIASISSRRYQSRVITADELLFQPPPTMCLYSKTILITGGFSCIFLWNIVKGELIKKINIIKESVNKNLLKARSEKLSNSSKSSKYSQLNLVKQIRIINQKAIEGSASSAQTNSSPLIKIKSKHINKLLLITDYTDSIYIIKIPSNIFHTLD